MSNQPESGEYDNVLSKYYGEEQVLAVITIKVDTKEADTIASEIANQPSIEDVYLVTGDTDIVVKARFASYRELKEFVTRFLPNINGIKESKTLMVVTAYKEKGVKVEFEG